MRNLLATGGAGLVGSHAVRAVRSLKELEKYRITILDEILAGFAITGQQQTS